ncbi:uncharacterized protein SPSK_02032 [Sporothrix schenckii 1099-18]|uniref:Uncharacterized protein n=1 Tax=Sporothrix schenckii 1099-18 TaxID=1397361 RepID=A0A0F2MD63_SPOSC|nr:uncharacterized protein SPSK_02032 [Sporothrix schenckii 1099-18]KJR87004.1 hypothetical protein SPSK_02032 [Sporothrix schenckii 1099-18]
MTKRTRHLVPPPGAAETAWAILAASAGVGRPSYSFQKSRGTYGQPPDGNQACNEPPRKRQVSSSAYFILIVKQTTAGIFGKNGGTWISRRTGNEAKEISLFVGENNENSAYFTETKDTLSKGP